MARSKRIEFCCCAIPLINVGSYTICVQFAIVAFCTLLLAVVPPSIVAATGSLPSGWPKIVVLILALAVLLWQPFGIFAIRRERTGLYRTYIRINFLLTLITIAITTAFFAVAAARHSTALDSCNANYGSAVDGNTVSELDSVGKTICNIWIWVQVGAMGVLLLVIGLMQLYMCALQRAYGKEMRRAAQDFKAYSGPGDEIPLATRDSAIWEPSTGPAVSRGGGGAMRDAGRNNTSSDDEYDNHSDEQHRYAAYRYGDESHAAGQAPYYGAGAGAGADEQSGGYYGRRQPQTQSYETYGQPAQTGGYYTHHQSTGY